MNEWHFSYIPPPKMKHLKKFIYEDKEYPWINTHPDNICWEDGTYSCTPLQEQIEIRKWLTENP